MTDFQRTKSLTARAVCRPSLVLPLLSLALLSACTKSVPAGSASNGQEQQTLEAGPGMGHGPGMGPGMGHGPGMGPGRGMGMMGGGHRQEMQTIHTLLARHESIRREVEDIPGGVRTLTVSESPEVAQLIREHVWQMKKRLELGQPMRRGDPLFRALFAHHDAIHLEVEEVPGGVRVEETSEDPQVVLLIRQHAHRAVNEFVEQGMPRAMQPTPLPEGYQGTP